MSLKKRLTIFYKKYCPDKISEIGKLIKKYGNKEKELFRKLTFKYGPEPKMSEFDKKTIHPYLYFFSCRSFHKVLHTCQE